MVRLIVRTPALRGRFLGKQGDWRRSLADALSERHGRPGMGPSVLAAAALDCLNVAVERWTATDGRRLDDLLDEAFGVLTLS